MIVFALFALIGGIALQWNPQRSFRIWGKVLITLSLLSCILNVATRYL